MYVQFEEILISVKIEGMSETGPVNKRDSLKIVNKSLYNYNESQSISVKYIMVCSISSHKSK